MKRPLSTLLTITTFIISYRGRSLTSIRTSWLALTSLRQGTTLSRRSKSLKLTASVTALKATLQINQKASSWGIITSCRLLTPVASRDAVQIWRMQRHLIRKASSLEEIVSPHQNTATSAKEVGILRTTVRESTRDDRKAQRMQTLTISQQRRHRIWEKPKRRRPTLRASSARTSNCSAVRSRSTLLPQWWPNHLSQNAIWHCYVYELGKPALRTFYKLEAKPKTPTTNNSELG